MRGGCARRPRIVARPDFAKATSLKSVALQRAFTTTEGSIVTEVSSYTEPVVTLEDAERAAGTLLESWWTTPDRDTPLPVDPLALARQLGIRVQIVPLPPDQSGNIVLPPDDAPVISLNRGDALNRQRFTCAHEIGHYIRRGAGEVTDRSFTDYRSTLAGLGVNREEIYANQFAAALLMPAHLVTRWRSEGLSSLARRFGTSTQAMELRFRNLRLA